MKHGKKLTKLERIGRRIHEKFWVWFYKLPPRLFLLVSVCPNCLRHSITVANRRTRTDYADPAANYEVSCIDCFEEHDAYWIERWDEAIKKKTERQLSQIFGKPLSWVTGVSLLDLRLELVTLSFYP